MDDDLTGKEFRRHGMRALACSPFVSMEDRAEKSRDREIDSNIDRWIRIVKSINRELVPSQGLQGKNDSYYIVKRLAPADMK